MNVSTGSEGETPATLAKAIAAHRFVAGMKPEYISRLVEVSMFKQFDRDEIIFKEGGPANRFYLICRGKIAVESHTRTQAARLIQLIGEDEVLGWSWLFAPYSWHFTARVIEPATAIFFYGSRLREVCDNDPAFGYDVMQRVAAIVVDRLQLTRAKLP
jgi:CRP-like cAMP-binding protein